jgi:hypothetical protein
MEYKSKSDKMPDLLCSTERISRRISGSTEDGFFMGMFTINELAKELP